MFIKLPFALKSFVLSIFDWPLKTGINVTVTSILAHRGYGVVVLLLNPVVFEFGFPLSEIFSSENAWLI